MCNLGGMQATAKENHEASSHVKQHHQSKEAEEAPVCISPLQWMTNINEGI